VEGVAAPLIVMLGQAAGMVVAFIVGDTMFGSATDVVKVLLALGLATLSFGVVVIANRPTPMAAIVIMVAVGALVLASAHPAFAEDGGWRSVGVVVVRRALLGGFG